MQALLYEYEQDLEDLLSYWLQQEHFTLLVAQTREEFFRICREKMPPLLLLGTCPPNILQSDVATKIRQIQEIDDSHLMILTTNTLFCHRIRSENKHNTSCVCTPITPKLLRESLQEVREKLGNSAGSLDQATASI